MAGANKRVQRINQIHGAVLKNTQKGDSVDKEKFIAKICCEWGTSRRTILEYVDNLVGAGRLIQTEEDGRLVLIAKK